MLFNIAESTIFLLCMQNILFTGKTKTGFRQAHHILLKTENFEFPSTWHVHNIIMQIAGICNLLVCHLTQLDSGMILLRQSFKNIRWRTNFALTNCKECALFLNLKGKHCFLLACYTLFFLPWQHLEILLLFLLC